MSSDQAHACDAFLLLLRQFNIYMPSREEREWIFCIRFATYGFKKRFTHYGQPR